MTTRYRIDASQSRFTVHADATGMLSVLGHSPTFAVGDYQGHVHFDDDHPGRINLDVVVRADSLVLTDHVSPADRRDIEQRMRAEVLETFHYPEIRYEAWDSSSVASRTAPFHVRMTGRLSLHGVTQPQPFDAEMRVFHDGIHLMGSCSLWMSRFQIKPVTALGGAIKLKDELKVSATIVALPEAS